MRDQRLSKNVQLTARLSLQWRMHPSLSESAFVLACASLREFCRCEECIYAIMTCKGEEDAGRSEAGSPRPQSCSCAIDFPRRGNQTAADSAKGCDPPQCHISQTPTGSRRVTSTDPAEPGAETVEAAVARASAAQCSPWSSRCG